MVQVMDAVNAEQRFDVNKLRIVRDKVKHSDLKELDSISNL